MNLEEREKAAQQILEIVYDYWADNPPEEGAPNEPWIDFLFMASSALKGPSRRGEQA